MLGKKICQQIQKLIQGFLNFELQKLKQLR